jgi:hypothetical protein
MFNHWWAKLNFDWLCYFRRVTGHFQLIKNRLAPVRTNRLLNPCVHRSPIQLRIGLRLNTLDQLKLVLIKHVPSSGS